MPREGREWGRPEVVVPEASKWLGRKGTGHKNKNKNPGGGGRWERELGWVWKKKNMEEIL